MALKSFLLILGLQLLITTRTHAKICQVYPIHYFYQRNSAFYTNNQHNCVNFTTSTYCRHPSKLTNNIIGKGTYNSWYFHEWNYNFGSLLFAFREVSLTHISLYYYCDNNRGLPILNIVASNITDMLTKGISSIAPGSQASGNKNTTLLFQINNTNMIQIFKLKTTFLFSLSEVQFFGECDAEQNDLDAISSGSISFNGITVVSIVAHILSIVALLHTLLLC